MRSALTMIACAALGGACHSRPEAAVDFDPADDLLNAAGFPAPVELLRGFDRRDASRPWAAGDEVLFGLGLEKAGRRQNWLLGLRVLDPAHSVAGRPDEQEWSMRINGKVESFTTRTARVEAVVMDAGATVLDRSEPMLPRDFLSNGIASACALSARAMRGQLGDPGERHRIGDRLLAEATVCAVSLLQVVQEDSVLAPLLWQVIEKPSIWSVVQNLGARVTLEPKFHQAHQVPSPLPGNYDPTWVLPIAISVNREPALAIELFVTEPASPYSLAGGLIGATARHPTRPDLSFSMLLLSARRAVPAQPAGG